MVNPRTSPRAPCVDGLIWDYDGTLVATRAIDEAAVAALVERDPSAAAGAARFWATEGRPILERVEQAWPGRAAEVLPLFDQPIRPHRFTGVGAVVAGLRRRGVRQAVVSSRRRHALERGLAACGLRAPMRAVVGLDDVALPKPSPEGLQRALRTLGVSPARAVYVGDREVDIEAGHAAGMTVWRAVWGLPPEERPPRAPGQLRHPREVLERLDLRSAAAG